MMKKANDEWDERKKNLERDHELNKVNKVFQTRMEVLSNICATKIDENVCHNLVLTLLKMLVCLVLSIINLTP